LRRDEVAPTSRRDVTVGKGEQGGTFGAAVNAHDNAWFGQLRQ
jgi:hypothetical protein